MLNKFNNVFSKGGDQPGMRSKKIDIISKSDYEYNQAPKVDETLDSQGDEEESKAVDLAQYEQTETYFIKLQGGKQYDMKIEHFDDLIQDNSLQSSWAGLDSFLIDEEFLYLEDAEADKIYAQLKQR